MSNKKDPANPSPNTANTANSAISEDDIVAAAFADAVRIRLAIFSRNGEHANDLCRIFHSIGKAETVSPIRDERTLLKSLADGQINSIILDFGELGGETSVRIISSIRQKFPIVPICLSAPSSDLSILPDVPVEWRTRLQYYIKFASDQALDAGFLDAKSVLERLGTYILKKSAFARATTLLTTLTGKSGQPIDKYEVGQVLRLTTAALSKTSDEAPLSISLPDFEQGAVQKLVIATLEGAKLSIDATARTNQIVVFTGIGILAASLIYCMCSGDWKALGFGALGTTGIVASLITNPLKALSIGSRRIVQVQVSYLGFLTQLSMARTLPKSATEADQIDRIRAVGIEVERSLKSLTEHFD